MGTVGWRSLNHTLNSLKLGHGGSTPSYQRMVERANKSSRRSGAGNVSDGNQGPKAGESTTTGMIAFNAKAPSLAIRTDLSRGHSLTFLGRRLMVLEPFWTRTQQAERLGNGRQFKVEAFGLLESWPRKLSIKLDFHQ